MAIGDLYNANNVVVGQAAVLIAPANTPLPNPLGANYQDPFDVTVFTSRTLTVAATTTYTISVGGVATSALTTASTGAQIQAALQALPAVGAGNATVTGSASPYIVNFNETVTSASPPVSVTATSGTATFGATGLWTALGATDQGWKYGTNKSVQSINIEEQSTPVSQAINSQSVTFEGALSEDITPVLAVSYNALLTSIAASASTPGLDILALTDTVLYYAVAMVTQHFNGAPRWVYAPKCTQLANVSTEFRRANAKRMYPVSFETMCKPGQIVVENFTAPHS